MLSSYSTLRNEQEQQWPATGGIVRLPRLVAHMEVVRVGVITGTVRINNRMQSLTMLSYSTLWAISVPQPIRSALAAEWITAATDPSLSPPPSFHFSCADIYWSLSENFPSSYPFPKVELQRKSSRLVCASTCVWFINEAEHAFIFHSFFSSFCLFFLFFDSLPVCPLYLFLSNTVSSPSIFLPPLDPYTFLSLSSPPSFTLPGRLYSLLNQYSSTVCKNCCTTRPDESLYSFIYQKVSSQTATDALKSAKDSGMSPVTSDSH